MLKGRRKIPWFGAAGMLLIFASWFVQTKYSSELAEARRNMDTSIIVISDVAATAEEWTSRYFELKAQTEPKRELLLAAVFKSLQWNLMAVKLAADRAENDDWALALASEDTLFQKTSNDLTQRFEKGQLEALEADLATFIKLDNTLKLRNQFNSDFSQRLMRVSNWRGPIDALVILLYVLGTALSIWDFIVRESGTDDVIVQQQHAAVGAARRRR